MLLLLRTTAFIKTAPFVVEWIMDIHTRYKDLLNYDTEACPQMNFDSP